jgi:hypothetical protein
LPNGVSSASKATEPTTVKDIMLRESPVKKRNIVRVWEIGFKIKDEHGEFQRERG